MQIEEILQKFYIYDIETVIPSAIEFARRLVKFCDLLCELMDEFSNFKRSKKIRELVIELNNVEEDCDQLYLTSMREITKSQHDLQTTIAFRDIFDCFEECADACEHVSECVETVIMKNT